VVGEEVPAPLEADIAPELTATDEPDGGDAAPEGELGEETQPAELHGGDGDGDRRRRRRGRRGGRRRRRSQGPDSHAPEQYGGAERGPRLQLELRPGEPGYSGPAEEFGEEADFVAAEEAAEADVIETVPLNEHALGNETQPAAERGPEQALAPKESPPTSPSTSEAEAEAERARVAYNVSPPHEVSGPASNPRRGWWRR
jgi:ribonuclease E